ncbi:hypothetical protein M0813_18211 [Anaeramoeba flamelloides]|uniref:RING-type domain-containing protein n=1 Tax=Anaeramoeba flamelloides TaxID=1746091 RepID=A0ABQ8YTE7_9EUKA|nr:hypothetical protein M0813_18211 [Anaeramoeba flamelloides]
MKGRSKTYSNDCVICLEKIKVQGRTSCCEHNFCFDCILKWSKVENHCPICRKTFNNIYKTIYPFTFKCRIIESILVEEKKQRIEQSEQENLQNLVDEESFYNLPEVEEHLGENTMWGVMNTFETIENSQGNTYRRSLRLQRKEQKSNFVFNTNTNFYNSESTSSSSENSLLKDSKKKKAKEKEKINERLRRKEEEKEKEKQIRKRKKKEKEKEKAKLKEKGRKNQEYYKRKNLQNISNLVNINSKQKYSLSINTLLNKETTNRKRGGENQLFDIHNKQSIKKKKKKNSFKSNKTNCNSEYGSQPLFSQLKLKSKKQNPFKWKNPFGKD